MKSIILGLSVILFASCSAQSIKLLKNTDDNTLTNCADCLQVRIQNSGSDNISKVVITNDAGESFSFDGVKAGNTGAYRNITKLCQCGYDVEVHYRRAEDDELTLMRQCRNFVKCTDYYNGKLTIDIKTAKLPADLKAKEAKRTAIDIDFKKD